MSTKLTLTAIKADVGGFVGHTAVHPEVAESCRRRLEEAREKGRILDFEVGEVGDDQHLLMTHRRGVDDPEIHRLAWDAFLAGTEVARRLKLYAAGQDLLADAFSGNVRGMGPGCAEMEFVERKSEPVIVFRADKCGPGAWNLPLFRMFADAFNTPGLVIDPAMHGGFTFFVLDALEGKEVTLAMPEDLYDLLALLGSTGRYVVSKVLRRADGEIAAAASTQKLALIAGKYVGKDDPVLLVRCQSGFPAVGEALEPFAFPHTVSGWMRGSHNGPLMPCSVATAHPTRFDGPPRVVAAGFQIAEGRLVGPRDLFDDPSFDRARQTANEIADYLRRHGPFEPHRLPEKDMEYTTLPQVLARLRSRFAAAKESNGRAPSAKRTRAGVS
ncbi:MAG TPA: fructose-1,6-bisphosphate aldolase/phosphatase [Planctomycetota bacterium]|jgi:fructose 1,6-bisphosphate aldolase/phosphatase|nr:fructose-1,6-bisphosphate aldolase/phosphatase [Planctomycetota bacterium]